MWNEDSFVKAIILSEMKGPISEQNCSIYYADMEWMQFIFIKGALIIKLQLAGILPYNLHEESQGKILLY